MRGRLTLIRIYIVVLTAVIVGVLMVTHWITQQKWQISDHQQQNQPETYTDKHTESIEKKYTLFHLDLKGAPPKLSYLYEVMPLIKKAGANGILLEYEDMFPWSLSLKNISASNAYKKEELIHFLKKLTEMDIEIIPLIQTFGHLEFILKLDEFRHLREMDSFPQEICPSKAQSFALIKEMIRQVMDLHNNTRYIHIGCDEVYHLASCPVCSRKNPRSVFVSHIKNVASFIKNTYPDVTVIFWDDMMRKWSPTEIQQSQLGRYVEPMVWVYIDDIPRLVPHYIWYVYKKTFNNIWGASAFKGAFGEREVLPNISRHLENNLAWQRLMAPRQKFSSESGNFRGLAVTGWSRYDHFAVLTELLPLSLPSLILALQLGTHYIRHVSDQIITRAAIHDMFAVLQCPSPYPFTTSEGIKNNTNAFLFANCKFPGSGLFKEIKEYISLDMRIRVVAHQKETSGWASDYNEQYKYSSPYRLLQLFPEEGFAAQRLLKDVKKLQLQIQDSFKQYYDNATIDEWTQQHLRPMEKWLENLASKFKELLEVRSWGRRPIQHRSWN